MQVSTFVHLDDSTILLTGVAT
jgi:hypothetical protein